MAESPGLVIDDEYPLSPLQQGMLFHNLDTTQRGVDLVQVRCTLSEPLDVPQFLAAWDTVGARYDILRTSFRWEGRLEPVQTVHRAVTLPARVADWRHVGAEEQRERLADLIVADRATGFELNQAPLMRLTIVVCGPSHYEVLWTFHHAILDGLSCSILLREVFGLYEAARGGRSWRLPAPRQYRAYIDWLRARNPDASKAFWQRTLAGLSTPTPLLVSVPSGRGEGVGKVELTLTSDETQRLHVFAREARCTVGTLVAGAWALLLSRYTRRDDVLFGVTRACRHSTVEGADEMVGLFINTLPFRSNVSADQTVFSWLASLRAEQLARRDHEHTPLASVQSWSNVPRGTRLFETLVVFEGHRLDSLLRRSGGAWINRRFAYQGQTNYPVTLFCHAGSELMLRLDHDRQALDGAIPARMLQHVRRLLEGLTSDGHRQIGDVPLLSAEERTELLSVPRPSGIQTFCLHERFERRAAETPHAPALSFNGRTLTYDTVNRRANQLAHRLHDLGVGPDVPVGVHLERSPELVIAILGILKAGGAYLPLDPAYPHDRLTFMVEDAHLSLVVTTRQLRDGFPKSHALLVCVEDCGAESPDNPPQVVEADNLAYVMYTAASTGAPSGVLVTHANVSRLFDASEIWFQFGRDDVWTLFHSCASDFSVWEIWGALLYGGRLVIVPYWVSRDPDAFIDLLVRERVTVLNQTPSAFRQLIQADGERSRPERFALRSIVLGGEALAVSGLRPWFDRHGDERPQVINMFGITETTVHVTYRRISRTDVDAGAGSVIGVPIADLDVYVLDERQQLVPVGVTGEIYIGGAGVARGYLDRADLTRTRFIVDPVGGTDARLYRSGDLGRWLPSGELEYRGRIDDEEIRGVLRPSFTSSGTTDRRALPAASAPLRTACHAPPRNETERRLSDVWASVLRSGTVGVDDNFFELGGDSMSCIQLVARCREAGLHLTTRDLFKHPTVAELAAIVAPAVVAPTVDRRVSAEATVTPAGRWFFDQPFSNRAHWNQALLMLVPGDLDLDALDAALAAVVARHDALRIRFREGDQGWESWYMPASPRIAVERVDLREYPSEMVSTAIETSTASAHAGLDLTDGPLLRLVHFGCAAGTPGRLLVVVHHLAADAPSFRVFLEDLESAYMAAHTGREPVLSNRTTSFKFWGERLAGYANGAAKEGLGCWIRPVEPEIAVLRCDHQADATLNTEASAGTVTVSLTGPETEVLLHQTAARYGTETKDLLLSALAMALLSWTGRDDVLVDVEGHGREEAFNDVDLSRTIGRFTTIFPVRLQAGDGTPRTLIERTKEALRDLHDHGLSFGALRYLSADPGIRQALDHVPRPQLLFSYQGTLDATLERSTLFTFAAESSGLWRAGENRRSHLLDVLALVADGRLRIQWSYSKHFHETATISALASRYVEALRELVADCVAQPTINRTPPDFALAELGQLQLDRLTARFATLVDVYPLTPIQQLFLSLEGVERSPGFGQWEFLLEGELDELRLREAWQQIAARHPIIRSAFVQDGAARPHQIVLDRVEIPCRAEDWRGRTPAQQDRLLREFLADDRCRAFDLTAPPLMRVALLRTGDTAYRLIWSTHRLLVDGWSWPRIFSELAALYGSGAGARLDPACSYREYVAWMRSRNGALDDAFWRAALQGVADLTPIPAVPALRDAAGEIIRSLEAHVASELDGLARHQHVTLGAIVGAAWSVVLAHHSGRSDVLFGGSFAGRPDAIPGIETMIGPCVNNLPIRVQVDPAVRVDEWLRRLQALMDELTRYQTTPLACIHACSGLPAWSRLFDSLVVVQRNAVDAMVGMLGDVRLRPLQRQETTNYPATIVVRPGERLEIRILAAGERFGVASAGVAADDLVTVLRALADSKNGTVAGLLACLPAETRGAAGRAGADRRRRLGPRLAPRTDMEKALTELWRDLFECEIGTDENYFELGAHSLMLLRVHARISATIKPDLPIVALFQHPTVRDLAAHLTAGAAPRRRDSDFHRRGRSQRRAVQPYKPEAEAK
jgi:amino acid adenylation domain-containing protein/non-ribosomal peptide synthase protein (TIGR01720 family)